MEIKNSLFWLDVEMVFECFKSMKLALLLHPSYNAAIFNANLKK